MGGFFKPWRRKVGVITLVTACMLATGWMRSFETTDWLNLSGHGTEISPLKFVSSEASIAIIPKRMKNVVDGIRAFDLRIPDLYCRPSISLEKQPGIWFTWRWKLCGFGYATENSGRYLLFKLPYWSIVLPLKLLSAFLLLSKPRKSSLKKLTEPTPVEGA